MKKLLFFKLFLLIIIISGCETIKKKSDVIVEKENNKLSEYIGKTSENLKINLGKPVEEYKNEKGNLVFIYKVKKYGILCERKFEIDEANTVVGFTSKGCF